MTVSAPFYVISTPDQLGSDKVRNVYWNSRDGQWEPNIFCAQRYCTIARAVVDAEEFDLNGMVGDFFVSLHKQCIGHNGQTVILPA